MQKRLRPTPPCDPSSPTPGYFPKKPDGRATRDLHRNAQSSTVPNGQKLETARWPPTESRETAVVEPAWHEAARNSTCDRVGPQKHIEGRMSSSTEHICQKSQTRHVEDKGGQSSTCLWVGEGTAEEHSPAPTRSPL